MSTTMTDELASVAVYQFRIYLREISPLIGRRLLVRSDSPIADRHDTLQIAMGWSDFHRHQFVIRGKRYGISRLGCTGFRDDPHQVRLDDFHFRLKERFLDEYDFGDLGQHEIRLEQVLPLDPRQTYPRWSGGAGKAPPEDCGGPWAFLALKQHDSVLYIAEQLAEMLAAGEREDRSEAWFTFRYGWDGARFDRRQVNQRLPQYATGEEAWRGE